MVWIAKQKVTVFINFMLKTQRNIKLDKSNLNYKYSNLLENFFIIN